MNSFYFLFIIFICFCMSYQEELGYSMIKEIDGDIYIGGKNYLAKYKLSDSKLIKVFEQNYIWDQRIMNGSDIGFSYDQSRWPKKFTKNPTSLAFDTCLNWKQEHKDASVRNIAFDYQHMNYHTPSGDWQTMNYTCMNSFIKSVEILDDNTLCICGTFGSFPRAFSVNKANLKFIKFVDNNMMSCARYMDEPMATYKDNINNKLYVASGWGLYRPDNKDPDIPDNNSTMLYADWRLYHNLFTLPSAMAWVLSSDVNFINVVKETKDHLYFFGHEISNQYGLNNQEDRHAWQSFLLRICKNDLGYKYIPTETTEFLMHKTGDNYNVARFEQQDYLLSPNHDKLDYNKEWYDNSAHLPKTHFVSQLKINFGCYIGKRPRAISDNHFWGDTNVVYLNKLADVLFDPNRRIKFETKQDPTIFGCTNEQHSQIPLIGIFNKEGISGTNVPPTGALCQLQINENIFNEIGTKKGKYYKHNILHANNAYEEIMALSSTSWSNFYSRTMHRTNGYTLAPYWNQGVMIGDNSPANTMYKDAYTNIGKCNEESFYKSLDKKQFIQIQNLSNTAWPNELPNRLTSSPSAVCQYAAAELYSFNASFVIPGVEFKKVFLISDNVTNYVMHPLINEDKYKDRRKTSPLMIVGIISTSGEYYRVVVCDFDNGMANYGEDQRSNEWYNWCIFRHSDQPYLYRQYAPMERREWGQSYLYRASSLLQQKTIINDKDSSSYPINRDPQFHIVKDVLRKEDVLHVLTTNNISTMNIIINCSNDYTICIDCASDPDCMWNNKDNKCMKYNEKQYKDDKFVQDVLDRGFKCSSLIIPNDTPVLSSKLLFECINYGYWRGKIQWKINDEEISNDPNKYSISNNQKYLTIIEENKNIEKVICLGLKDDVDKLFDNNEYKWINSTILSIKLVEYKIGWKWNCESIFSILIIIIIILVIVIICISILFYQKYSNKCKSDKICDKNDNSTEVRNTDSHDKKSSTSITNLSNYNLDEKKGASKIEEDEATNIDSNNQGISNKTDLNYNPCDNTPIQSIGSTKSLRSKTDSIKKNDNISDTKANENKSFVNRCLNNFFSYFG